MAKAYIHFNNEVETVAVVCLSQMAYPEAAGAYLLSVFGELHKVIDNRLLGNPGDLAARFVVATARKAAFDNDVDYHPLSFRGVSIGGKATTDDFIYEVAAMAEYRTSGEPQVTVSGPTVTEPTELRWLIAEASEPMSLGGEPEPVATQRESTVLPVVVTLNESVTGVYFNHTQLTDLGLVPREISIDWDLIYDDPWYASEYHIPAAIIKLDEYGLIDELGDTYERLWECLCELDLDGPTGLECPVCGLTSHQICENCGGGPDSCSCHCLECGELKEDCNHWCRWCDRMWYEHCDEDDDEICDLCVDCYAYG